MRAAIVMSMSAAQAKRIAINPWTIPNTRMKVRIPASRHTLLRGASTTPQPRNRQQICAPTSGAGPLTRRRAWH
jgi:hypothetical protein